MTTLSLRKAEIDAEANRRYKISSSFYFHKSVFVQTRHVKSHLKERLLLHTLVSKVCSVHKGIITFSIDLRKIVLCYCFKGTMFLNIVFVTCRSEKYL